MTDEHGRFLPGWWRLQAHPRSSAISAQFGNSSAWD
jgi:hypothetical protein